MSVLVVGASGMLGHRIVHHLSRSREVVAVMREGDRPARLRRLLARSRVIEVRALGGGEIAALFEQHRPQVVVNAAGLIKQRPRSSDPIAMIEANALLPHRLADEARACGSRL